MRKVLITGSNGNLGRAIFASENKVPYSCFFLSKHIISDDSCRPNRYIKADISKEEDIDPKLWGVDDVFHMAGSTHERNPKKYYINNFEATKRLIDKSEANGVNRFIYISSQAIGEKGGAYSHSKELAENYLMQSRLAWTIIRPADIYDTGNKDSISSLCKLIKTSRLFPIIGDGEYKINPIHIDDFKVFILRLLECESKKSHHKIYNLSGPEPVSFKSFCEMRCQDFGKKILFFNLPVFLCKWFFSFVSLIRISNIVPDQIDRLMMEKDHCIELASKDYQFMPRKFSYLNKI